MKKMKIKKKTLFIMLLIVVIFIFGFLIFRNKGKNTLIGTWTTDGVTVYEFKKNNAGALVLPLSTYEFTYKVEENKLYIDFKNEKSTDSSYEYSFKNGQLILKGINKTTGTYTFKRQK